MNSGFPATKYAEVLRSPKLESTSTRKPEAIEVKSLGASDYGRWDAFVHDCPDATFFHLAAWRDVIERAFGHKMYYLYAEVGGRIKGVLPLGRVQSRLFGDALVSNPFCVYGGIAAVTDSARQALENASSELARKFNVDYLEMRNLSKGNSTWPGKDLYYTFRKPLHSDPEKNMQEIPRKQRAMVRKGIQAGLRSEVDSSVDRCYAIYSESVRNLGTPVYARRYFELLKEVFGDQCEVTTVIKEGAAVASVLSFYFRDQVLPYYGGSTTAARHIAGCNDFMYWEVMRRACERGCGSFDYGRSKKGTGAFDFKRNWGFEPEPLRYQYYLVGCDHVPDAKNPLNPKYRLFISLWRNLPLPVSRFVGPYLAKDLG